MDNAKLNELAAKAMGYRVELIGVKMPHLKAVAPNCFWRNHGDMETLVNFNPSTCADDALTILEKVSEGRWTCVHGTNGIWCFVGPREESEHWSTAETASLAMTVCALRAAGISETEIADALK